MGIWNTSIWGDDVAQDLKLQLKDAYAFNDDETALSEIFRVNESILADETDEDYTVFYYALADWLWDKGRLPENIKQKVKNKTLRKLWQITSHQRREFVRPLQSVRTTVFITRLLVTL